MTNSTELRTEEKVNSENEFLGCGILLPCTVIIIPVIMILGLGIMALMNVNNWKDEIEPIIVGECYTKTDIHRATILKVDDKLVTFEIKSSNSDEINVKKISACEFQKKYVKVKKWFGNIEFKK